MKLDVSDILKEPGVTKPFQMKGEVTLPEGDGIQIDGPVEVRGVATSLGDGVHVEASARGSMILHCSRCLSPFRKEFRLNAEGNFLRDVAALSQDGDQEVFELLGDEVDLSDMVAHEIVLDVPMKPLCREDCKGICPTCGANLNEHSCECRSGTGSTTVFGRKLLDALNERSNKDGRPEEA